MQTCWKKEFETVVSDGVKGVNPSKTCAHTMKMAPVYQATLHDPVPGVKKGSKRYRLNGWVFWHLGSIILLVTAKYSSRNQDEASEGDS